MISADELRRLAPSLRDVEAKADLLNRLGGLFLEHGSKRGVTALKTAEAIKAEFLLDSLGGLDSLPESGTVVDIGTGGGVPGLVLAIARPDLDFVLSDSAAKKTDWVRECAAGLRLSNVRVVTQRLELMGRDLEFRESFQAVTAKALAPLNVLLEFAIPLLAVGGRVIAYKGPALSQEIGEARRSLELLSAKVHRCLGYRVDDKVYRIAEIVKSGATSDRYPRRDGVPQKKPL